MSLPARRTLVSALLLALGDPVLARFVFSDRADGIACPSFDVALGVPWPGGRPGWTDAAGQPDGERPFASLRVTAERAPRVWRLGVTSLVRAWAEGRLRNDGLFLRASAGIAQFHSRESPDPELRPQLLLHFEGGRRRFVEVSADATLDCTTVRGLGAMPFLTAHGGTLVALRFVLPEGAMPAACELILVSTPDARPASVQLDVFAVRSPLVPAAGPARKGIASRYPADRGIASDPEVLFADDFQRGHWDPRWTSGVRSGAIVVASPGAESAGPPLSDRSLRATIPRGQQLGVDLRYPLRQHGEEPEEVFFRYYLRLAADWVRAGDGGKLPGLAGTYGRAGWGGRPWDGAQGWSLRGSYGLPLAPDHGAAGEVMLGTYAYHANAPSSYGEVFNWTGDELAGLVKVERWYGIEQHLRLNAPGRDDGLLEVWVDGRPALVRKDLRLRDTRSLRIEHVWLNVFHGGTARAPADMNAFITNVVVAKGYIGTLSR